ncbi:hypothetical protein [uncultured Roseibium sp.]|uniref:hypothetical protein n=1 Tax=uncultured Roseibium sp. TaxID=1936171 RepID=UPI002630B258|nr:hypothetical protein [uncultured Roseibium sp.]
MPFQLNIGDHVSPHAGFTNFNLAQYRQLKWSREKLFEIVRNNPDCDSYFRSLPKGRSLTDLINDDSIWVNFGSSIEAPRYGKTCIANSEIGISERAFILGRWTVLATLIHELAYLNGASLHGGDTCAEEAVYYCGLVTSENYDGLAEEPNLPFFGNSATGFASVSQSPHFS